MLFALCSVRVLCERLTEIKRMGEKVDNQPQAVIGVDIGGTNIKIALVEPRRQELLEAVRFKTVVDRGPDAPILPAGRIFSWARG